MIRVRNLRVWFVHRQGLLREMMSTVQKWVRAVDGVSFDVKRGEVFCLVGESGCGKTTTGKTILQLEEAKAGDIFLEMPDEEYARYETLNEDLGSPEADEQVDELRRRYSLTWKETNPWTTRQRLLVAGMVAAATALALLVPAFVYSILTNPFDNGTLVLVFGIVIGLYLGSIGAMPPSRPWKGTAGVLALLAFVITIVDPILVASFNTGLVLRKGFTDFSVGDALAAPWSDVFGMIISLSFSFIVAYATCAVLLKWRQQSEGLQGIKMRGLRKRLHLIFQDPYESLNPKQSIYEIVSEPLRVNHLVSDPEEIAALVSQALNDAGLRPPEDFMFRFPHEVSGGQRQRVSIAAALALQPDFIVADEPVSMLDVSIRTDILQLMMDLRRTRGLTYLFITHDLSLAWVIADHIAVMYLGKIVEIGTSAQVIRAPKHPYTQALISVVPSPDPRHKATRQILKGERPDPIDIPRGCRFHPRCPVAFERCGWSPEEVLDALRELAGTGPNAAALEGAAPDSTLSFRLPPGSEALETWIREQKASASETRLALKALRGITGPAGARRVVLFGRDPVPLVEVAPGNAVACLRVTADAPAPAATVTA